LESRVEIASLSALTNFRTGVETDLLKFLDNPGASCKWIDERHSYIDSLMPKILCIINR
jgi:hypothetical protein